MPGSKTSFLNKSNHSGQEHITAQAEHCSPPRGTIHITAYGQCNSPAKVQHTVNLKLAIA